MSMKGENRCWERRLGRIDFLIAFVLAVAAAVGSLALSGRMSPDFFDRAGWDTYFESDMPRIYSNMSDADSDHHRTSVHPLFSLLSYTPVRVITGLTGAAPLTAMRTVTAAVAAGWCAALFLLLRVLLERRVEAALFTLLTSASGAAVFWFAVPESYSFGSLTILAALLLVAVAEHRRVGTLWYILASAATLSITITNWMVGVFSAFVRQRWWKAIGVTVAALLIVSALWLVQKSVFPSAGSILDVGKETDFAFGRHDRGLRSVWRPGSAVVSFALHGAVVPEIREIPHPYNKARPGLPIMLTQGSLPGSGSAWGLAGAISWMGLLAIGLVGFFSCGQQKRFRLVLGLAILGQLLLHVVYGDETFLYSLHFQPLLVVLASFALFTRFGRVVIALTAVTIVCALVNNLSAFAFASNYFDRHSVSRDGYFHYLRGVDHWHKGEDDQAIGYFDKAIESNRGYTKSYYNRGRAYLSKGNYEQAIRDLDQAIQLNPEFAEAHYNRGLAYQSKGEYDRAIQDFDKAIELNSTVAEAYYKRGLAYQSKGEYDRAIQDFDKAIQLDSSVAAAHYKRGTAYLAKGSYFQASENFRKAIELNPTFAPAHMDMGLSLQQQGKAKEAITYYRQALRLRPDWLSVMNNLAWILATHKDAQLRDGAEAVRLAERTCQLVGYKAPAVLDTLAAAYAEVGPIRPGRRDCSKSHPAGPGCRKGNTGKGYSGPTGLI